MGFEVTYFFHERQADGKYNTEEKKEMKKKVGTPFEEMPLEQLASVVMSQLARRDIWVIDVEVFEYTKKKLSFKESTDGTGIIIKNKKFSLDKTASLIASELQVVDEDEDDEEENEVTQIAQPPAPNVNLASLVNKKPLPSNENANRASNLGRVKRWLVFDPELPLIAEARQKGLRFTVGKKYPVYNEAEHPLGLMHGLLITTVDDSSRQQTVPDKYFIPGEIRLMGDFDNKPVGSDPRLSHQGMLNEEIPVLRPMR